MQLTTNFRAAGRQLNVLRLGLSCAAALLLAQPAAHGTVTITTIGKPVFEVVDTHVYAAPTDSFPSLFPKHFPERIVHGPPYDREYADGLALTGFPEREVFSVAEFTSPSAVHLGYVLVPNSRAPSGSSFDYKSGPIIPNDILPITAQGDVFLNGALFEQNAFGVSLPAAGEFAGRSHFLVEHWENSDFAPPGLDSLVGNYEYRLRLRDMSQQNGYDVVARFGVVPEPVSLSLVLTSLLGCGLFRRR